MIPRHVFIINPKAGKTSSVNSLTELIEKQLAGESYGIYITEYPGHGTKIAEETAKNAEREVRIYACGGDGTLNEAVNGLYHAGCPQNAALGIIPTGSGNDFIKSFGLKRQDYFDISRIADALPVPIDLLVAGGYAAVNIISAGFDAAVAGRINSMKKLPLIRGKLMYNISTVYGLIADMKHKFQLYADDEKVGDDYENYLFAIAANGQYYGGGFCASPLSDLRDGYMDFIRIPTVSRLKFIKLVNIFKRGEHLEKLDFIKHIRCKALKIIAEQPIKVNLDGEIIEMENPEIKIIPSCLRLILPVLR